MTDQLKPCTCGFSELEYSYFTYLRKLRFKVPESGYFITCLACGNAVIARHKEEAFARWNKRTTKEVTQ